jgi:hypothetical protein
MHRSAHSDHAEKRKKNGFHGMSLFNANVNSKDDRRIPPLVKKLRLNTRISFLRQRSKSITKSGQLGRTFGVTVTNNRHQTTGHHKVKGLIKRSERRRGGRCNPLVPTWEIPKIKCYCTNTSMMLGFDMLTHVRVISANQSDISTRSRYVLSSLRQSDLLNVKSIDISISANTLCENGSIPAVTHRCVDHHVPLSDDIAQQSMNCGDGVL